MRLSLVEQPLRNFNNNLVGIANRCCQRYTFRRELLVYVEKLFAHFTPLYFGRMVLVLPSSELSVQPEEVRAFRPSVARLP
jgi:hypothetical protein